MAQCKLTPHEFIQNAFSPMVSVMCSPSVDQTCQKNNLSFIEMIQPFCKINTEAHFRDPSGNTVTIRNLRITMLDVNSRPPQPTLARKFLNESVSLASSDRTSALQIGNSAVDIPASVPWFEAWRETFLQVQFPSDHEFTKHYLSCILVVSSVESSPADVLIQMNQQLQQLQNVTPAKLPKWFSPNVLRYYVLLHDAQEGGLEKAECAFENIKNTYGAANCYFLQMNSRPPGQVDDQTHLPDPWSQFLIRHLDGQEGSDHDSSPRTPAEVGGLTGLPMPSRLATEGSCDSDISPKETELAQEAGEGTPSGAITVTRHPLSPSADSEVPGSFGPTSERTSHMTDTVGLPPGHINSNVWAGQGTCIGGSQAAHGACLTAADLDRLRTLVQDFCIKALLPHVERQVQQLSDAVSNKKGVSRSLLSATKRWFGSNKPGMPNVNTPTNAMIYASDASELQLRRLGDLCFMFGHYALAFQAYHSAKRDFSADQAWLYYAGALEMAALSAFMQGEPTRKAQEYMEESIVTYLNSCKMPQFATRATLLSTECLKGRGLYGEAAQQFIRMTSEDSDLRSALLLEQAAYCFLKAARPCMARKYAFHAVLAGHRFSKAGQRRHALRCYRQAYQVYENKSWSLAEDHIHFTIGRQAANLKLMAESVKAFARLLSPLSRQTAAQQAAFLREYVSIQQQQVSEEPLTDGSIPELPLPIVEQNSVRVLVGPLPCSTSVTPVVGSNSPTVPASGVTFEDDDPDTAKWPKLEEMLITAAQKQLPMIFKPTIQMFSNYTDNSRNPVSIVGEPVSVQVKLVNPLQVSLPLHDLQLLWSMRPTALISADGSAAAPVTPSTQGTVEAQVLPSLLLPADSCQPVVLSLTPRSSGELHILGITYSLSVPATDASGPGASVCGRQLFHVHSRARPQKGRKEPLPDKRLQVQVVPTAPCLQVNFVGQSSDMLCGEVQQVVMEFRNIGSAPLSTLHVASSAPELFVFEGEQVGSAVNGIVHIPLTKLAGKQLGVGQVHKTTFWVRAPDVPMEATLDLLFYYENVVNSAVPRYRLVRHQWILNASAGLQLTASALPSCNSHQAVTRSSTRLLNLPLQAKNLNQVQDSIMTEVSLVQILLASTEWQLSQQAVLPKGVQLQAQEKMYFLLQASRLEDKALVAGKENISHLWLTENSELQPVLIKSPYLDFFDRYVHRKGCGDAASEPSVEQGCGEGTNEPGLVDLCLLVQWQASVVIGQGARRSAVGQTCILVRHAGVPASWPPAIPQTGSMQALSPSWPLSSFGVETTPALPASGNTGERFPALEALQKLVIFTISHPPRVMHDFKSSRLCVVPVQLLLQNCSQQQLLVKINTLSNSNMQPANKSQLYSPHSSAAFRWVGLAKAWLELPGHASATVALAAALGSPGTFDMGAHLEVWCCEPGAPAANAVSQSWRVESALIVSSMS
ncbi:hypothetical protein R5R35_009554 [Gryllus longicercus]|uniref:Trafficking protein particle complex subunit 8 n=1 Tax=Gryllus longicercus TaxID=2509291 RepID=A0AAN9Z1B2_9ORTH